MEYIWQADPAFWAKSSPVLFPVVGQLKGNTYYYQNTPYSLPRHGFAREMDFALETSGSDHATFLLTDSEETRKKYPFEFKLRISYTLKEGSLAVSYSVTNPSEREILFSLGAHPAFNVPLVSGTPYDDHYLLFSHPEKTARWNISPEGLIETSAEPLLADENQLKLSKALFERDALVFKDLQSQSISLLSNAHGHGIRFSLHGFPYFGIWAAPGADFVCLEPWAGIADSVSHNQQLTDKEGILRLPGGAKWNAGWEVHCF